MSNNHLLIQIAELYYFKGWTQQAIANEVGVSRTSISRMLDEAREKGIVEITIKSVSNRDNKLEIKLKEHFNLKNVIVFNGVGMFDYDMNTLGDFTSKYLLEIIKDKTSIGISWGRSVQSVVSVFPQTSFSDIEITQLNGGIKGDEDSPYVSELVFNLGNKLNAKYNILDAPAYVSSKEFEQELTKQTQISDAFEKMKHLDIVVTGIGDLKKEHNTLYNAGIIGKSDMDDLLARNVTGHILGRMFDCQGEEVEMINKYAISMELEDLKKVPNVIAAVMTAERAEATKSAIDGKLINTLICDDALAEELLKL